MDIPSVSERIKNQIVASIDNDNRDLSEFSENTRDYVFSLQNSPGTARSRLRAILDLNDAIKRKKPVESLKISDVLPAFEGFHVASTADLLLAHRMLRETYLIGCTKSGADILYQLGIKVATLKVSGNRERTIKSETICSIANLIREFRPHGQSFSIIALKQLAAEKTMPENVSDQVMLCLSPYTLEPPPRTTEGDLYAQTLNRALEVVTKSNGKAFGAVQSCFVDLANRCPPRRAAELQQKIFDMAIKYKLDPVTRSMLQTQLGYLYLLADKPALAEKALRHGKSDIANMPIVAQTLLAECLKRQRKFTQCEQLASEIENSPQAESDKDSYIFIAFAKIIRAQNAWAQRHGDKALKLLEEVEPILSRNTANLQTIALRYPRLSQVFSDLHEVLSQEIDILQELGRTQDAAIKQSRRAQCDVAANSDYARYESSEYLNLARFEFSDAQAIQNAERFMSLCKIGEPSLEKRRQMVASYIDVLIDNGFFLPAQHCLDKYTASGTEFANAPVFQNQRIQVAILKGDLASAKTLLAEFDLLSGSTRDDKNRADELRTIVDLIDGNYEKCELDSRPLEKQLFESSDVNDKSDVTETTAQDEFVAKYRTGLLARAQALAHLKNYKDSLVLSRRIVRNGGFDDVAIDALSQMARCYQQTGHPGLASTAENQATDAIQSGTEFSRKRRLEAGAKFQLAQYWKTVGNTTRSQRCFSEAIELAKSAHLENTSFYRELEEAAIDRNVLKFSMESGTESDPLSWHSTGSSHAESESR